MKDFKFIIDSKYIIRGNMLYSRRFSEQNYFSSEKCTILRDVKKNTSIYVEKLRYQLLQSSRKPRK